MSARIHSDISQRSGQRPTTGLCVSRISLAWACFTRAATARARFPRAQKPMSRSLAHTVMPRNCPAARTRRAATGRLPACRCCSTGATSPRRPTRSRRPCSMRSSSVPGCPATWAIATRRARPSFASSAMSTCAPANRSSTRLPTASSRSRRMRKPLACSGFMTCAISPASWWTNTRSVALSPDHLTGIRPKPTRAPATGAT